jgi:hypothetical protein
VGLTSDDKIDQSVSTLRELTNSRFAKVKAMVVDADTRALCSKLTTGMTPNDVKLTEDMISRIDVKHLKGNHKLINENFVQIVKSMQFLGFYDDYNKLATKDAKGN